MNFQVLFFSLWTVGCLQFGSCVGKSIALKEHLRVPSAIVNEVHCWAVCECITSADDMAQNLPRIVEITSPEYDLADWNDVQ